MGYIVFKVNRSDASKIEGVLKFDPTGGENDPLHKQKDLVSRQSIVIRDAVVLEMTGDFRVVLIEGSDDALNVAKELFKGLGEVMTGKDSEAVYEKIKKGDEAAAVGMGTVFDF
jgi:hypothetical protein